MTIAAVRKAAREVVGTDDFRPGQAEAIEAVLQRDTPAVPASGTGKTAEAGADVIQGMPGRAVPARMAAARDR